MYIHVKILNDLKPNLKLLFVIVFFTISLINIYSQSFELKIYSKDTIDSSIIDAIKYKKYHLNKKSILKEIDSIATFFWSRHGRWYFKLDSKKHVK